MTFPVPEIDHRTHRQLVREALDRVPYHTPEWTNLNDSDPGVTLVQLFAFLTESLNYRANLIPERNRAKFLQLLGIPLQPAAAARGLVVFLNERGPLAPTTLLDDTEVLAGRVPFRTETALTVLPVAGKLYTKAELDSDQEKSVRAIYETVYEDLEAAGNELAFYETRAYELPASGVTLPSLDVAEDTVDGALWLALLARRGESPDSARAVIEREVLTLGVVPALDERSRLLPAGGEAPEGAGLVFEIPRQTASGVRYERLEARPSADLTHDPGTVELRLPSAESLTWNEDLDPLEAGVGELPPSLSDTEEAERLITWIRIRSPRAASGSEGGGLSVRLAGVWVNAAEVAQRARVEAEQLPPGTGEPEQTATLVHTPVLPDSLRLTVNGEVWQPIDDLAAAPPEVAPRISSLTVTGDRATRISGPAAADPKVYQLDPRTGTIRFGTGEHGMRPPRGATILASYAYGGGRQGVVGIGAVTKSSELPAGIQVSNPAPTWGGDEPETVGDAEHRIPQVLRNRERLVTRQDFREIAWGTPGVDLGRVEVLPLFHPSLAGGRAEGVVTLLLIPLFDPIHPDHPEPDRLFLDSVCRHLDPRRLVTTELHLRGPVYRDLWVSIGVEVLPEREQGPVLDRVEVEIRRFLSPLAGGFEGRGWPLEKTVEPGEIQAVATRVEGVAKIVGTLLGDADGAAIDRKEIRDLELPRLAGIAVGAGEPVPLSELLGGPDAAPGGTGAPRRLPVPIVPEEC